MHEARVSHGGSTRQTDGRNVPLAKILEISWGTSALRNPGSPPAVKKRETPIGSEMLTKSQPLGAVNKS